MPKGEDRSLTDTVRGPCQDERARSHSRTLRKEADDLWDTEDEVVEASLLHDLSVLEAAHVELGIVRNGASRKDDGACGSEKIRQVLVDQ